MSGWDQFKQGWQSAGREDMRLLGHGIWLLACALFIGSLLHEGPLWLMVGSGIIAYLPIICRGPRRAKPVVVPPIEPETGEFRCAACNHRERVNQPMSDVTGYFLDDYQIEMSSQCGTKLVIYRYGRRAARCPLCHRITHWKEPEDV